MTKSELRALIARQVAALPPDYCREADGAICRHVLDWEVYRQAKAVFCYVGTDREIDTRPILRDALDRGKVLAVPLCVAKGVMEARQIRSLEDLVPGKYGILEPGLDCPLVAPEALDLALVPCSTGSRSGRRLGYGGGYYDRFLPRTTCPKALLCRGRLVRADIPTEDHDQLMDFLVTEEGLTSRR